MTGCLRSVSTGNAAFTVKALAHLCPPVRSLRRKFGRSSSLSPDAGLEKPVEATLVALPVLSVENRAFRRPDIRVRAGELVALRLVRRRCTL
jgi:hypothetical protein